MFGIQQIDEVRYLSQDRCSLIVSSGYQSGQGTETNGKKIFLLDGWGGPVILHERDIGADLSPSCGKSGHENGHPCYFNEVFWNFTDLTKGRWGQLDLVETLVFKEGDEPDNLNWRIEVRTYLFKGKKFIPVDPHVGGSDLTPGGR